MITTSGRDVWPERGSPSLFDIGVGLSRIPRFAGQTRDFYSVLSHCIVVSDLVPPELEAYALLHDAAECVRGDIPTSWKIDPDRRIESLLMRRIYREVGILVPSKAIKRVIKRADTQALMAEAHIIGAYEPEDRWPMQDIDPYAVELVQAEALVTLLRFATPEQSGEDFEYLVNSALEKCERIRT